MTTPLWSAAEAAAATNGMQVGDWAADGVSIDSRTVAPGDLFVAIRGPHHDGHDFVKEALERGAAAAMVHAVPGGVAHDAPLLVVPDTAEGLVDLARYARMRSEARVAAVTGSVGKTSTKEALRAALAGSGATFASSGNLNNQWGVPLSLACMPQDVAFGVFELGMNHPGEIAPLSRFVEPDVGIVTTVEAVHLEHFASDAAIADAKAEIFCGMGPDSTAILNRDNRHFARLVAHARTRGVGRIWSFGTAPGCDARLIDCSIHAAASAVTAEIRGEMVQYTLSAPGRHWIANSLAVLLAVRALDGDLGAAMRALGRIQPMKGRGGRSRIEVVRDGRQGTILLIDESYNASPVSMAAALEVLGQIDVNGHGRRIAVLGDMLELGPDGPALHRALAPAIEAAGIDLVFGCGPLTGELFDRLPPAIRGAHAADAAALAPIVAEVLRPGDAVMVKGSLGSRMATVVAAVERLGAAPAETPRVRRRFAAAT